MPIKRIKQEWNEFCSLGKYINMITDVFRKLLPDSTALTIEAKHRLAELYLQLHATLRSRCAHGDAYVGFFE